MTMPNFLIIGARKCGTTSMHAYLSQHPQVFMSARKELHFFEFGEPSEEPLEFPARPYASQTLAAFQTWFDGAAGATAIGEASPSNFYPRACRRIQRYLPDARFICVLRQPAERQYSDFLMRRQLGTEPVADLLKALRRERQRQQASQVVAPTYEGADWYLERLRDWFARFDRRQCHIGLFEDLKADPVGFMRQVYAFLEVDACFAPDTSRVHNQSLVVHHPSINRLLRRDSRTKQLARRVIPAKVRRTLARWLLASNTTALPPPLAPQLRRELTRPQRDDILRLQDLLGRDLTHWLAE